jgi:hypothetical protein
MRSSFPLIFALAMFGASAGCDTPPPALKNAAPSVLVVAVRPDPGVAEELLVDVYVRDIEGDPVDLLVELRRAGGAVEPTRILVERGHGYRSLHSEPGLPGAWHRLVWKAAGVEPEEEVSLLLTPEDDQGNVGETSETPAFKRSDGWTGGQ